MRWIPIKKLAIMIAAWPTVACARNLVFPSTTPPGTVYNFTESTPTGGTLNSAAPDLTLWLNGYQANFQQGSFSNASVSEPVLSQTKIAGPGTLSFLTTLIGGETFNSTSTVTSFKRGTLVLDGPETFVYTGYLYAGVAGRFTGEQIIAAGSLEVSNGASLRTTPTEGGFASILGSSTQVPNPGNRRGFARVAGANSVWTLDGQLALGIMSGSIGTLSISDGGTVFGNPGGSSSSSSGVVGYLGGSGLALIEGTGSRWLQSGTLNVGFAGAGTMLISTGGEVVTQGGWVGRSQFGVPSPFAGFVAINDPGSRWEVNGPLQLESGTVIISNGGALDVTGQCAIDGAMEFVGGVLEAGSLSLSATGNLRLASGRDKAVFAQSLTIAPSAFIDLSDNAFVLDYTGASPQDSVRTLITSGFAMGNWNGSGIRSSAAALDSRHGIGFAESQNAAVSSINGYTLDSDTILIRYTLLGDADLNARVDIADFSRLAASFGASQSSWSRGDFNYDGTADIGDFALLASNFNRIVSTDLPRVPNVPEPAATGWVAFALASVAKRLERRHGHALRARRD